MYPSLLRHVIYDLYSYDLVNTSEKDTPDKREARLQERLRRVIAERNSIICQISRDFISDGKRADAPSFVTVRTVLRAPPIRVRNMLASSFADDVKTRDVAPSRALPAYLPTCVYAGTNPLAVSERGTMPLKIWDFADTMSYVPLFGILGVLGVFAASPFVYGADFVKNRTSRRTNLAFTYELTLPPTSYVKQQATFF